MRDLGHRRRVVAGALAFAVVITACGGGDDPGEVEATSADATETSVAPSDDGPDDSDDSPTPTEGDAGAILTELDEEPDPLAANRAANDGFLDTQAALDLFARAYGDVPGADPDRFADVELTEGTMALRNITRVFDELTAEQQAAVRAAIDDPPTRRRARTPARGDSSPAGPLAQASEAGLLAQAEVARLEIEDSLGRRLGLEIRIEADVALPNINADSYPFGGDVALAVPYTACRIRVSTAHSGSISNTIAHEVMHCFEFAHTTEWPRTPDWVAEGGAEWVGARVGGHDLATTYRFQNWLGGRAAVSLFDRDYDAIGLYWTMEQAGVDPWAVLDDMNAPNDDAAIAATGLAPSELLRHIASTGSRFEISDSVATSPYWRMDATDPPPLVMRVDQQVDEDSPYAVEYSGRQPWTILAGDFHLDGDVVDIDVTAESGVYEFIGEDVRPPVVFDGSVSDSWCLREGGCCPGADGEDQESQGTERLELGYGWIEGGDGSVRVATRDIGEDGGFADGTWTVAVTSTPYGVTSDGGADLDLVPATATLDFVVEDGRVSGTYAHVATESGRAVGDQSNGISFEGTISTTGELGGWCWGPRGVGESTATMAGTMTDLESGTPVPVNQSFVGGDVGINGLWEFETSTETTATGRIDVSQATEYMAAHGFHVDGIEVTFEATRTD